jgi:hypothetical protein
MSIPREKPNYQKKYRNKKTAKGFVRYEIQISYKAKERFEKVVAVAANEYAEPYSKRQRMAKARSQIFEEITKKTVHQFFTLTDEIENLRKEIAVLAPSIFEKNSTEAIPSSIAALPDQPQKLKGWLAQTYQVAQKTKKQIVYCQSQIKELNRRIERYQEVVASQSKEVHDLRLLLKNEDLTDNTGSMLEHWDD